MFTGQEIDHIIRIIDKNYTLLIYTSMGVEVLTDFDKSLLLSYGIDVDKMSNEFPVYYQNFLLGRLTALLQDQDLSRLTQEDFQQYLLRGQFVPLSQRERAEYEYSRAKTYNHIKGLANKITTDARDILLEQNKMDLIKEEIEEGVKNRLSVQKIVSNLGHKTEEWERDWKRIVVTEMQDIYNQGRATEFGSKYGQDCLVWKQVFEGACRHCIALYLTDGIGSKPRVFKMSTLVANGNNYGLKVADWKPIIGSTHPHCFTLSFTPILTSKGWKKIKDIQVGDLVMTHKGRFRKVTQLHINEKSSFEIDRVFSFSVKTFDDKVIKVSRVTPEHPFLIGNKWTEVRYLNIGDKVKVLTDRCDNIECENTVDLYRVTVKGDVPKNYCTWKCCNSEMAKIQWQEEGMREKIGKAVSIGNTRRFKKMSKESLRELTLNARKANQILLDSGEHPMLSDESKRKANSTNGKRKTFIERKLHFFLDEMGIKYETDFFIVRDEFKNNNQHRMYFPDIYIRDLNMVIEADGENWHDEEYDKKRDKDIKELIGADTFRFKEDDILNNGDKVFKELERLVKNHRGVYGFRDAEIIEIEENIYKSDKIVTLYNFSVEEDESYIVNGVVVHNCRCDIRLVFKGMQWDQEKQIWDYTGDIERKVVRKSKIKMMVNDKEFLI